MIGLGDTLLNNCITLRSVARYFQTDIKQTNHRLIRTTRISSDAKRSSRFACRCAVFNCELTGTAGQMPEQLRAFEPIFVIMTSSRLEPAREMHATPAKVATIGQQDTKVDPAIFPPVLFAGLACSLWMGSVVCICGTTKPHYPIPECTRRSSA